jgi:hypothetical protein
MSLTLKMYVTRSCLLGSPCRQVSDRLDAEKAQMVQLDRDMCSRRRALERTGNELALATAGIAPLQGEHLAMQTAVVNDMKVRDSDFATWSKGSPVRNVDARNVPVKNMK